MGCCASRPHGEDGLPASRRASTEVSQNQQSIALRAGSAQENADVRVASTSSLLNISPAYRSRAQNALSLRNNKGAKSKPLRKPSASTKIEAPLVALPNGEPLPASNMAMLRKARREFYETRVTGTPEMWGVIRTMCNLIEEGALEDAQAMIDAAGGSCPTGQVWGSRGGCFDDRGARYVVPSWCVACPKGIDCNDGSVEPAENDVEKGNSDIGSTYDNESESYGKEAKGKGKMAADMFETKGKQVTVKIRYSHTARDDVFVIGEENSLEMLAQMAKHRAEIPYDIKVRFVYLGRLVDHRKTVSDLSWKDDSVLSLFVFE